MLVMQCGYAPQYVLDEIETYELTAAMKYSYYATKSGWEQARLISYIMAQCNSSKRLQIQDIIEFPWEKDEEEKVTSISKKEIEILRAQANNYLRMKNKNIEKRDNG